MVVDEAVLSLTGYKLADPIAAMYAAQSDERPVDYLRNSLVLANPDRVRRARDHTHDDDGRGARGRGRHRLAGPQGLQGDEGIQGGDRAHRPAGRRAAPGAHGRDRCRRSPTAHGCRGLAPYGHGGVVAQHAATG